MIALRRALAALVLAEAACLVVLADYFRNSPDPDPLLYLSVGGCGVALVVGVAALLEEAWRA